MYYKSKRNATIKIQRGNAEGEMKSPHNKIFASEIDTKENRGALILPASIRRSERRTLTEKKKKRKKRKGKGKYGKREKIHPNLLNKIPTHSVEKTKSNRVERFSSTKPLFKKYWKSLVS